MLSGRGCTRAVSRVGAASVHHKNINLRRGPCCAAHLFKAACAEFWLPKT